MGHAVAMDRMYRLQRHIYDLTRKYFLLGRDRLINELTPPDGGGVLEIGCGTGRNLVHVGKKYPNATLYGFDISEEMLKSAQKAVDRAGLTERVHLAQGDATNFDAMAAFGRPDFERVFTSYTLSMIPDWRGALAQGLALTAPGGRFAVVDFGDCARLPGVAKSILYGWLDRFHVTPRLDMPSEAEGLAAREHVRLINLAPSRGYACYLQFFRDEAASL